MSKWYQDLYNKSGEVVITDSEISGDHVLSNDYTPLIVGPEILLEQDSMTITGRTKTDDPSNYGSEVHGQIIMVEISTT